MSCFSCKITNNLTIIWPKIFAQMHVKLDIFLLSYIPKKNTAADDIL